MCLDGCRQRRCCKRLCIIISQQKAGKASVCAHWPQGGSWNGRTNCLDNLLATGQCTELRIVSCKWRFSTCLAVYSRSYWKIVFELLNNNVIKSVHFLLYCLQCHLVLRILWKQMLHFGRLCWIHVVILTISELKQNMDFLLTLILWQSFIISHYQWHLRSWIAHCWWETTLFISTQFLSEHGDDCSLFLNSY